MSKSGVDETAVIERIEAAFRPYIRSPQEAVRIRRLLTLYLNSLIVFPEGIEYSHAQLCIPQNALTVKKIPKEVTGVRRKYLESLRANIAARNSYDELRVGGGTGKSVSEESLNDADGAKRLQMHLHLLKRRQRHAELQIEQHYLGKLSETNPVKDGFLDLKAGKENLSASLSTLSAETTELEAARERETMEALTEKLERAVLKAKLQLERERRLLAEVKARYEASDQPASDANRLQALSATRDELVRWIEEKLSKAGAEGQATSAPDVTSPSETRDSFDAAQMREEIMAQYEQYIKARKKLLDAATAATSPLPQRDSIVETKEASSTILPPALQRDVSFLPFVSQQLVKLLQSQRAIATQQSYISKEINKEKSSMRDTLERLSDESHLLPAYPIMARQDRFKSVVAALRPSSLGEGGQKEEIIRRAEAWAFASKEANLATEELVGGQAQQGKEHLDHAQKSLAELDALEGQGGAKPQESDESEEEDIWAGSITSQHRQRRKARQGKLETGWAGLNGRIGL